MLRTIVATVMVGTALSACAPDLEINPPGPSAPVADSPAEREPRKLSSNKLSSNKLSSNKLSSNALTANPEALGQLVAVPLATSTFVAGPSANETLRRQLEDPEAREVMHYIVDCALPASSTIHWESVFYPFATESFAGGLGLCAAWEGGAPDEQCQELVSACVLARVNAFGIKVALRLDGEPSALFPTEEHTPVVTWDASGEPHPAFVPCPDYAVGSTRDCGWQPAEVGTCSRFPYPWSITPAQVTVGAGAGTSCADAVGSSSGDSMLRVCEGTEGCTHAAQIGENDDRCGLSPGVTFDCPVSGKFAVMKAAYNSAAWFESTPASRSPWTWYATPDYSVYDVAEGGFYGNIFDPQALNPALHVTVIDPNQIVGKDVAFEGPTFGNMWACWSPTWTAGDAYLAHRICSGPTATDKCAATVVGACGASSTPAPVTNVCALADGPEVIGNADVQDCADSNGRRWQHPITVWLSRRCAAVPGYCQ